ncbi:hypothetical protein [Neisseria sp. Ec49-e6-T10]|uniref:hypothetical protein n=1 Tax=Neisseria sp. Ec49-e6-T10 TaxID=3140744 RepID=UPI003EB79B81
MNKLKAVYLFSLLFLSITVYAESINKDSIYKSDARTYFQAIDFRSPQSSSEAFISAWKSRDYVTFFALLDTKTQANLIRKTLLALEFDGLFLGDSQLIFKEMFSATVGNKRTSIIEYGSDFNLFIDDLLMAAEKNKALPFVFGEQAKIAHVDTKNEEAKVTIQTDSELEPKIVLTLKYNADRKRWKIAYIQLFNAQVDSPIWGK